MSNELRIPKQERSKKKKKLIKEAALKLFSENGYYNTSTNEIAKEAGLSIGTFYSYFADKKAVYQEIMYELYSDVFGAAAQSALPESSSVHALIRHFIGIAFAEHEHMKDFQKQMHILAMTDEFHNTEEENHKFVREMIINMIEKYRPDFENKQTAAFIIQNMIESTVHETVLFGATYEQEKITNELAEMICKYFGVQ